MYKKVIPILLITLLITGCHPCKRLARLCPPVIKDSIVYTETIKEDPHYTIPDSAYWELKFECDSNYNVILHRLHEASTGIRTETKIQTVYKEDDKKVKIMLVSLKARTDSIETLNRTIEKLRNEVKTVYVDKEVIKYKSRKVFIYSFVALIVIVLVGIVITWFKFKSKIIGLVKH